MWTDLLSRTRTSVRVAVGVTVLGAVLLAPFNVAGQTLRGRVVDSTTGAGIPDAIIRLVTMLDSVVATATADTSGYFDMRGPGSGEFRVAAERTSYLTQTSGPIRLTAGATTEVILRLSVGAVPLEPITVVAESRVPWLDRVGFYTRKDRGFGRFIERPDIDKRNPRRFSELFQGVPGVRVIYHGPAQGYDVQMRAGGVSGFGSSNSQCLPNVYVDGLKVADSQPPAQRYDLNAIVPTDVEAVEIYSSVAQLPAEYGGATAACGVVLIWTRR